MKRSRQIRGTFSISCRPRSGEIKKTLLLFVILAARASTAPAGVDVTGKWSGSFDATGSSGETKASTALFIFKQSGNEITGTVGPRKDEQFPIQKERIEGDKITLEPHNNGQVLKFNLVFASGRITGANDS